MTGQTKPIEPCRCRAAVERAYRSMQRSGSADSIALEVAVRVYRHHHPEASEDAALTRVECWVQSYTLQ
ncbi:MAG: hypothetical protein RLO50_14285 [Azospirillaceae bacterium]